MFAAFVGAAGCTASAPPVAAPRQTFAESPAGQEAKRLINEQSDCFVREVKSVSARKVDLETAALAVQGSCITETQRLKLFSRQHTIETYPQFEARWRETEARDLQQIKQMLAIMRTSN